MDCGSLACERLPELAGDDLFDPIVSGDAASTRCPNFEVVPLVVEFQ
jgi:hypothetical protein